MIDPDGDAPLSIEEAANAYANVPTEEAPQGQAEPEEAEEGDTADVEDTELSADEVESEETDEGESDADDNPDDDSADEPESDQGRFVAKNGKVRLDDGSVVTVEELIGGHLRQSDYTRKTMEHSEAVKAFQSQSSAIKQREAETAKREEFVTSLIRSIVPPSPDPSWADPNSPNYKPDKYLAQRAAHEHWAGYLNQLQAEQDRTAQARQTEEAASRNERATTEWAKLTEIVPDLKAKDKAEAFAKDLLAVGQKYGWNEQELLAQLPTDHRFSLVLRDASRWQRYQANKAKAQTKVEGKPPVLKGGARVDPQRAKAREGRAAMERLTQTGSLRDGVAALLAIEGKG